jgi:hypothetical protein
MHMRSTLTRMLFATLIVPALQGQPAPKACPPAPRPKNAAEALKALSENSTGGPFYAAFLTC